jgi:LmbE family N-acetylglucosaminyl deacetylase
MVKAPARLKLKLLFVGAHPDDADFNCGGTAIRIIEAGHEVMFVSLTDGSAGHQQQSGAVLAKRRYEETQRVAELLGLCYQVWDNQDANLEASKQNRNRLITMIRKYQPTLIVTHRPNDYHTDHRRTSILVQDAAFLVGVPNVCPLIPPLTFSPVILYAHDFFQKPYPFRADIIVDITSVYQKKLQALALHESQLFEWLPYIERHKDSPPEGTAERLAWIDRHWGFITDARQFAEALKVSLPPEAWAGIAQAEAFEICEYGARIDRDNFQEILPVGLFVERPSVDIADKP